MRVRAFVLLTLLAATALAGCSSGPDGEEAGTVPRTTGLTAHERVALPFDVGGEWSKVLSPGPYAIKEGTGHFVSVDLPVTEGGAAVFDPVNGPRVHLGLFLPDVPAGTQVPVIADAGPYYATSTGLRQDLPGTPAFSNEMDPVATEPANRLGRFLIETFVPLGYAVAQVSVFGSGDSNHCFDMFGTAEQMGVDAAVTWLGSQDWSNGNVALIGRSYDGSTPWMSAASGNPHLKTIVPISGLHGLQSLTTHNGSSEGRVATFQNVVYGGYWLDGDAEDVHTLCPDSLQAIGFGAGGLATGGPVLPVEDTYWQEREFLPRVLENYEGSVYLIHGLQDWNVDPHMVSPTFKLLRDRGLDVKGLFGQWGHMYPDRPGEHANLPDGLGGEAYPFSVRFDWAEDLREWFGFYLKGEGPKPVLKAEVQDNIGRWRVEDTYPPAVQELAVPVGAGMATLDPNSDGATFDLGVVDEDRPVLLSGHLYLDAAVVPSGGNAQVYFQVDDRDSGLRLAFGTMDILHRDGEATPAVPGSTVHLRVQSQPFEFVLPAGHRLELQVSQTGGGYLPTPTAAPAQFDGSQSTLFLPVRAPDAAAFFTPPAWEGTAKASPPQP